MIRFYYASSVEELRHKHKGLDSDTWPFITAIDEFTQVLKNNMHNDWCVKDRLTQWAKKDLRSYKYHMFVSEDLHEIP